MLFWGSNLCLLYESYETLRAQIHSLLILQPVVRTVTSGH